MVGSLGIGEETKDQQMNKQGILSGGLSRVMHNKRYIFWFWLLNLTLAEFATAAFRQGAHAILDHTLYAKNLLNGFDVGVFGEMLFKPDFGSTQSMTYPAAYFGFLFFMATALFLPGVFSGYASTYRLPREEFFRACGRNLWRFIRILIIAGIVMGIVAGVLFAANSAITEKANDSTNEKLPFELEVAGLTVIFLIMTILRIWFDLAEVNTVLDDQRSVRRSISMAFRHTFRGLLRLLTSYVVVTIIAALILAAGLWIWMKNVAPNNVYGAWFIGQITLFLLLIPRFWQRGIAVSYWQQKMLTPVVVMAPIEPVPVAAIPAPLVPEPAPIISTPTPPQESN
jgi:NADH:ubiquinone oxidoreductase subunit 6 (subunit J)